LDSISSVVSGVTVIDGITSALRNALVCVVVGRPPKLICACDDRKKADINIVKSNLILYMVVFVLVNYFLSLCIILCKDKSKMLDLKSLMK